MRRQSSRRRAFTLVELLVVIGIIAILISILFPALNRTRDKARAVQCASNMRQLYLYCSMFAQDNKGNLPRPGINEPPSPQVDLYTSWAQDGPGRANFTSGALWRYIVGEQARRAIIFCPGDNGEQVRYGSITRVNSTEGRNFSYSMNAQLSPSPDRLDRPGKRLGSVKYASEKIMWFEEIGPNDCWCLDPINNEDDTPSGRHAGQRYVNALRTGNRTSADYKSWLRAGRGNHCFFDGHVELLSPGDIINHPAYYTPLNAQQ
jgi:prepilin-type N-terminal cleavage/methylation domain-containing protein/prepilin-type processing-associated H-X9-DG protein